jgi:DNA-binding CsgD family transcriptional regulator
MSSADSSFDPVLPDLYSTAIDTIPAYLHRVPLRLVEWARHWNGPAKDFDDELANEIHVITHGEAFLIPTAIKAPVRDTFERSHWHVFPFSWGEEQRGILYFQRQVNVSLAVKNARREYGTFLAELSGLILDTVAMRLRLSSQAPFSSAECASLLAKLRPREHEILCLIVAGTSNRNIATILGLEIRTVESYLYRLYHRLGVHSRAEAIAVGLTRNISAR